MHMENIMNSMSLAVVEQCLDVLIDESLVATEKNHRSNFTSGFLAEYLMDIIK